MRVLIVGCGRVGATLARMLSEQDHKVTIIDQTADAFRRLGTKYKGERMVGSGTDTDVLKRAGIENADVFVSVTDGDNRNIMAAQIAKHVYNIPCVLTRIYDPSRAQAYRDMGIHTFCPTSIAAGIFSDIATGKMDAGFLEKIHDYSKPYNGASVVSMAVDKSGH